MCSPEVTRDKNRRGCQDPESNLQKRKAKPLTKVVCWLGRIWSGSFDRGCFDRLSFCLGGVERCVVCGLRGAIAADELGNIVSEREDNLQGMVLPLGFIKLAQLFAQGARCNADDGIDMRIEACAAPTEGLDGDGILPNLVVPALKVLFADVGEKPNQVCRAAELGMAEHPLEFFAFFAKLILSRLRRGQYKRGCIPKFPDLVS